MFIDVVPNGRSAPAVLLRESYRAGSKVRKRTLANLGQLPPAVIDGLRVLLQGGAVVGRPEEVFEIQRALPHGHVAAVIGMIRKLDLPRLLGRTVSRGRDLALAMIASRLIARARSWRLSEHWLPRRRPPALVACWTWVSSKNVRSTPRWTGSATSRTASSGPWPGAI